MTANELHTKFTNLVKTERKVTQEVLHCIQQIDKSKAYAELGYSSLFDYLVQGQKYSEGSAQRRISAARLLQDLPAIEAKVQDGKINLTQLAKLSVAVKQELKATGKKVSLIEKAELVHKLEGKNAQQTDILLGQELNYSPEPQEKVIPKKDHYYLTLKMTRQQYEKLQRVQSILSHSLPGGCIADVIETLCDKLIQRKERSSAQIQKESKAVQVRKDGKNLKPTAAAAVTLPEEDAREVKEAKKAKVKTGRVYVPVATQRYLFQKANHCCEYVSAINGNRCASKFQLQLDHVIPIAKGGGNCPENMRVLCRTHNLSEAKRWGLQRH